MQCSPRMTFFVWPERLRASRLAAHLPAVFGQPPIDSILACQHVVTDELAPQRGAVPMMALDLFVDFGFGVTPIRCEVAHQPTQHGTALAPARRNARQC